MIDHDAVRPGAPAHVVGQIWAITRRDVRIFVTYRLQVLMEIGSGIVLVVGLFFMDRVVGDSAAMGVYAGRYFEFALIGVVLLAFVEVGLGAFTETIAAEQRAGTLEVLLVTPTRLATMLTGMFVFPLVTMVFTMIVYVVTAVLFLGARIQLAGLLPGVTVLALTVVVFAAVGGLSGALMVLTKRGDPIGGLAMQAATLLGGALFPITVLPGWLQALARLLPPYHALEGLRATLIEGGGFGDVLPALLVLSGFAVVLLPVSLLAFSRALRKARTLGTLGAY